MNTENEKVIQQLRLFVSSKVFLDTRKELRKKYNIKPDGINETLELGTDIFGKYFFWIEENIERPRYDFIECFPEEKDNEFFNIDIFNLNKDIDILIKYFDLDVKIIRLLIIMKMIFKKVDAIEILKRHSNLLFHITIDTTQNTTHPIIIKIHPDSSINDLIKYVKENKEELEHFKKIYLNKNRDKIYHFSESKKSQRRRSEERQKMLDFIWKNRLLGGKDISKKLRTELNVSKTPKNINKIIERLQKEKEI